MCKVCSSLVQKWGNERAITGSKIILTSPLEFLRPHQEKVVNNLGYTCTSLSQSARKFVMPSHYSNDLRWRVIWQRRMLNKTVTDVSRSFVQNMSRRFNATGDISRSRRRRGPETLLKNFYCSKFSSIIQQHTSMKPLIT